MICLKHFPHTPYTVSSLYFAVCLVLLTAPTDTQPETRSFLVHLTVQDKLNAALQWYPDEVTAHLQPASQAEQP